LPAAWAGPSFIGAMTPEPPASALSPEQEQDEDLAAALKLWVVLSRAQKAVQARARRDIERHGVGVSEFAVLELLFHRGSLTTGQVGERVLLTRGSTTYVVDKLATRGLVARRVCAEDQRITYLDLTDAGRRLIGEIFPEHAEAIRRATSALSLDEKRECIDMLRRLGKAAATEE
jgi:MarR family 2-MHQ and catechol resistance regulon transcriptional repressor